MSKDYRYIEAIQSFFNYICQRKILDGGEFVHHVGYTGYVIERSRHADSHTGRGVSVVSGKRNSLAYSRCQGFTDFFLGTVRVDRNSLLTSVKKHSVSRHYSGLDESPSDVHYYISFISGHFRILREVWSYECVLARFQDFPLHIYPYRQEHRRFP